MRYIIPFNYSPEGSFKGKDIRNYVEAAVILIILGGILFLLPFEFKVKLYIGMIVVLPCVAIAVIGINGMSLMTFLKIFLKYKKEDKEFSFPTVGDQVRRRRLLVKKKKEMAKAESRRKRVTNKANKRNKDKNVA